MHVALAAIYARADTIAPVSRPVDQSAHAMHAWMVARSQVLRVSSIQLHLQLQTNSVRRRAPLRLGSPPTTPAGGTSKPNEGYARPLVKQAR